MFSYFIVDSFYLFDKCVFFFKATAPPHNYTNVHTLSLHDRIPVSPPSSSSSAISTTRCARGWSPTRSRRSRPACSSPTAADVSETARPKAGPFAFGDCPSLRGSRSRPLARPLRDDGWTAPCRPQAGHAGWVDRESVVDGKRGK